jgi:hypothetical protein
MIGASPVPTRMEARSTSEVTVLGTIQCLPIAARRPVDWRPRARRPISILAPVRHTLCRRQATKMTGLASADGTCRSGTSSTQSADTSPLRVSSFKKLSGVDQQIDDGAECVQSTSGWEGSASKRRDIPRPPTLTRRLHVVSLKQTSMPFLHDMTRAHFAVSARRRDVIGGPHGTWDLLVG